MPILANKKDCIGCTSCLNGCPTKCIEMKMDKDGFKYPEINYLDKCINCGECAKVCPVLKADAIEIKEKTPLVYAALSTDEAVRMESSSGGVFSELAKIIISQNGVVYGAAYDEQFVVRHCSVETIDDLWKLRGAKYSESDLGDSFVDILTRLNRGEKVLFSGTPCQVAGLKAFVRKDYANLYCIDFVCHGVPSPMAWNAYINYRSEMDANGEKPSAINLRSKSTGWSGYQYSNIFEYKNGTKHSDLSSQSLFMKLFIGDYISREACSTCKFKGYDRVSDLTIGDFWGIWDVAPDMDDNKGTSVVLVHSNKGRALWEGISSKIKCKEVTLEQASQQNPSMLMASRANDNRNAVLAKIRAGEIGTCEDLFMRAKPSAMSRLKGKVRRILQVK